MITLDGFTLDHFGLIALQGHQHPIPQTIEQAVSIPYRNGVYVFDTTLDVRQFDIPLAWIRNTKRKDTQARIHQFTAFMFDDKGKPRDIKLVFDYDPKRFYIVRYSGQLPIERILAQAYITLPLVARNPLSFAHSNAFDHEGVNPTYVEWTTPQTTVSLYNYGDFETSIRFDIEGKVNNPSITNNTTGETNGYTIANGQDEAIVVDGNLMQSYQANIITSETYFIQSYFPAVFKDYVDRINILQHMSGDFITLRKGLNEIQFNGVNPNAMIRLKWLNQFI